MNSTENQRCSCEITIRGPRNLSPIVVWSFYAAAFVGLLISIVIIFVKQNNSEEIGIRTMDITDQVKNNGISETSLKSLMHHKLLLKNSKNISWIDGSNDEIYYRDINHNVVILNATKVLEDSQRLIEKRINIRETLSEDEYLYHTSFKDENLIISPDKLYVAILSDIQKSFTEISKYKVNIKEFSTGIEKKILRNGNFISDFSFSSKEQLYFYTYNDNGNHRHYKCFLNHSDLNVTLEFCQIEFERMLDSSNQKEYCNHNGNFVRCNSLIHGIQYKENGTVLLYPKVKTFVYNRAITKSSGDEAIKPEIIYFGGNGQRGDEINYSYREEFEYESIEYTIHNSDEALVFYGLRGKKYSYYFPSKQKAFFIKPAHGIIQLDSKPWVLHPFIYHNDTSGMSTFNMAISTSNGVNRESQIITNIDSLAKSHFTPLLSSEFYVTEILKVRRDGKTGDLFAYFTAAPTGNVSTRNFYKIKISYPPKENGGIPKESMETVICLTCPKEKSDSDLESSGIYPQCLWADVEMSSLGDYYLLHCKGPDVPWTVIVNTQTNKILFNFKENEEIRAWDSSVTKPRTHEFLLELEDDFIARVRMYFPFEWNPEIKNCPKKYKLLLHVDGTPEGQLITAKYQISWLWELILNKNYIVVEADVRGSGYQSIETSSSIWKEIGTLEIEDQISVIKNILKRFNCIDPNQIAVYGEAYGGYTALNIMAMDENNIFKCCAAVSPITTWQHYSHDFSVKVFGGKYNNSTKKNYERANLSSRVCGLKNKNFIIYTATMNEKILRYHVHNFLAALADNGILFKHQQYIDQGHDFSYYNVHLYKHMDQYFDNCFAKKN